MNMVAPRTTVIGVGKDGSEAARRLIYDGTIQTCLIDLHAGEYKPALEVSGEGSLVLVIGTIDPKRNFEVQLGPALSVLSHKALNVAVINTVNSREGSKQCSLCRFLQGIMTPVDAYFTLDMVPRLFFTEGGRARTNALSNAVRIMLEMMTVTDNVMISFDDFKYIMAEAGLLWLSTGAGSGKDRAIKAARTALTDLFSCSRLIGARKVLLRIVGGDDLLLSEVHDVLDIVQSAVTTDTDVIFGVARNHTSYPSIKVTLMATHFTTKSLHMFTKGTVV
jgi:cell division GTPase FtsZ